MTEKTTTVAAFPDMDIMRQVLDATPDAKVMVDADGRIRLWSSQAGHLFGYASEDILGQPVETLIPVRLAERHRQHREHFARTPRRRPMGAGLELMARCRDGTEIPVEVSLSPVTIGDAPCVIASIRDIGPRLRAEENQRRLNQQEALLRLWERALRRDRSEDICRLAVLRLKQMLNAARVRVFEIDLEASITYAQLACDSNTTDAPRRVDLRNEPQLRALIHEEQAGSQREATPPGPHVHRTETATETWVALQAGGALHGALAVSMHAGAELHGDALYLAQNVAHLLTSTMIERQESRMLVAAAKMEALGQLSGGIAHDFNNLLSVISGNLELLGDLVSGKEPERLLHTTRTAVRRGSQLTKRLLLFARKQAPRVVVRRLQEILPDLADVLTRVVGESVRLRLDIPDDLPPVLIDPAVLDACVINLATNARDAMHGDGTLTLSARARHVGAETDAPMPAGLYIALTVADTGPGMSEEVRRRAFEPFFTTKATGRGTGLGLSMARTLIHQINGWIDLDSSPGKGTRVHLHFPVAPVDAAPRQPARADMPTGHGEGIVVVEDDDSVRATTCNMLQRLGYRPVAVASTAAAWRAVRNDSSIAAVFSDVVLGHGGSGFALARRLYHTYPELPVLLTSGHIGTQDRQSLGMREREHLPPILPKPYTMLQLGEALQRALARRAP